MNATLGTPGRRHGVVARVRTRRVDAQPTTTEDAGPIEIAPLDLGTLNVNAGAPVPLDRVFGKVDMGAAAPTPASAEAPVPEESSPYSSLFEQLAPVAKSVLTASADEDVRVLKAQIANHEKLRDTLPEPFKTIYGNKVRVLKAKLAAAKLARKEEQKTTTSRWEWASLGKTGIVVGILAGSALTALLVSAAIRESRRP